MGIFSDQKPYSAVTNWVEQLCSEQYEEDDYTGVPDLCDVARLQATGPTEAARAIRKKLKYGNVHRQARALTLLDAMLLNGDKKIRLGIAKDEPLLERLRILVSDPMTDAHVKRKAIELFASWSANFRNEPGMQHIVSLRNQLPTKKRTAPQVRPPTPENEQTSPARQRSSSGPESRTPRRQSQPSSPQQSQRKLKSKDDSKFKGSFKPINLEKERPLILQTIAASQQASTNLSNALKRLNRETHHPEQDQQIQQLYRQCRKLRKDILIFIQRTESEEWLGTLINANEEIVQALAYYERSLKPIEQDSDSDAWSVSDSEEEQGKSPGATRKSHPRTRHPQRQTSTGSSAGARSSVAEDLAQRLRATSFSMQEGSPPPKPPRPIVESLPPAKPPRPVLDDIPPAKPPRPVPANNSRGKKPVQVDDDDDPFGDQHGIHTNDGNGWG